MTPERPDYVHSIRNWQIYNLFFTTCLLLLMYLLRRQAKKIFKHQEESSTGNGESPSEPRQGEEEVSEKLIVSSVQEKEKINLGLQSEESDGNDQEISESFGDVGETYEKKDLDAQIASDTAENDEDDDENKETIEIGNRFHELSWASYYLRYQKKYKIKEFDLERTFYNQLFLFAIQLVMILFITKDIIGAPIFTIVSVDTAVMRFFCFMILHCQTEPLLRRSIEMIKFLILHKEDF